MPNVIDFLVAFGLWVGDGEDVEIFFLLRLQKRKMNFGRKFSRRPASLVLQFWRAIWLVDVIKQRQVFFGKRKCIARGLADEYDRIFRDGQFVTPCGIGHDNVFLVRDQDSWNSRLAFVQRAVFVGIFIHDSRDRVLGMGGEEREKASQAKQA